MAIMMVDGDDDDGDIGCKRIVSLQNEYEDV